uniref:Uncharacterized protein n=1 Tax=Oreochromis aureus TaxID=47969 RepID=A0AAZ1XI79_OREAU
FPSEDVLTFYVLPFFFFKLCFFTSFMERQLVETDIFRPWPLPASHSTVTVNISQSL